MTTPQSVERFAPRGRALRITSPLVMGVLNVTPDSFSDGGVYTAKDQAVARIEEMVDHGAAIIDIGGESTRPGSDPVSEEEELRRVIPVLKEAVPRFDSVWFSIDTTKYEVARQALEAGVHIVNDVSGLRFTPQLAPLSAEYGAAMVLMHSVGNPKTMQQNPAYEDVVQEVCDFLAEKTEEAKAAGVTEIITDPGIGFGKTLDHNLRLLANVDKFTKVGYPVLIGASRKSMFSRILGERAPEDRVTATVAAHYHALMLGASVLRVHDVRDAQDAISVFNAIRSAD